MIVELIGQIKSRIVDRDAGDTTAQADIDILMGHLEAEQAQFAREQAARDKWEAAAV